MAKLDLGLPSYDSLFSSEEERTSGGSMSCASAQPKGHPPQLDNIILSARIAISFFFIKSPIYYNVCNFFSFFKSFFSKICIITKAHVTVMHHVMG